MHQYIFWAPFQFPSRMASGADQKLSFDWGLFENYVENILSNIDNLADRGGFQLEFKL